jgi:anti-sigma regulatory factor (Ser/Thr protein kinase)
VLLVPSEFVTNAFLHGGGTSDRSIDLRVSGTKERIMIEVDDHGEYSPRGWAIALRASSSSGGGFGLSIVERLAETWAIDQGRAWATILIPA